MFGHVQGRCWYGSQGHEGNYSFFCDIALWILEIVRRPPFPKHAVGLNIQPGWRSLGAGGAKRKQARSLPRRNRAMFACDSPGFDWQVSL
jgi:hypothetical protein